MKQCIKSVIPASLWDKTAGFIWRDLPIQSLLSALREQGLGELYTELKRIVPDLSKQYTAVTVEDPFYLEKLRCQHAFQISLAQDAFHRLHKKNACIVDIGDSAGTHLRYLKNLPGSEAIQSISVNLDPVAVAKIKALGLQAVLAPAEELHTHNIFADILLSFEMLEHLIDPISFLSKMAHSTPAQYFVISVPYVRQSRVGLWHIRGGKRQPFGPEETHIFEFSPEDWRLIFSLAGWKVVREQVYLQYPKQSPLRLLKGYWTRQDYEGFYGVILEKDLSWNKLYAWPSAT